MSFFLKDFDKYIKNVYVKAENIHIELKENKIKVKLVS